MALGGPTRWWGRKCARGEVLASASVLCATPLPRGPSALTRRRATLLVHNSTMTHRSWRQIEASSNGRDVRRGNNMSDWSDSAKEWQAAITILIIIWGRCTRFRFWNLIHTRDFERRIVAMQAMLAICSAHSGGPGAVERRATAVKRSHDRAVKKTRADREAAQFSMTMGVGGEGNITLAEGLVDVEVTFNGHKRARWSRSRVKGADSRVHGAGGASRRTGGRRRAASGWDSSESESSDSGLDVAEKDGCAGSGRAEVVVGDRIRIYWTGEEVWFRCDVRKVFAGTDDVEVEYLVDGVRARHCLTNVSWEPWCVNDEVDVRECEFDGEHYLGPMDVEAQRASESKRKRGRAEEPATPLARGRSSSYRHDGEYSEPSCCTGDADVADGHSTVQSSYNDARDEFSGGRFNWVMTGVRKGARLRQRRALARCMIEAWSSLGDDGRAPRVSRKELYRRGSGVAGTSRAISAELTTMRDSGLVVFEGDDIVCGEAPIDAVRRSDDSSLLWGTSGVARRPAFATPTIAVPTERAPNSRSNAEGKKRMVDASGRKRGREMEGAVLGADRVTRSRSCAPTGGDVSGREERGDAGTAEAGSGPVVRRRRSSDWAAYLARSGQTARLEAWRKGGNVEEDHEMVGKVGDDEWGLDE